MQRWTRIGVELLLLSITDVLQLLSDDWNFKCLFEPLSFPFWLHLGSRYIVITISDCEERYWFLPVGEDIMSSFLHRYLPRICVIFTQLLMASGPSDTVILVAALQVQR